MMTLAVGSGGIPKMCSDPAPPAEQQCKEVSSETDTKGKRLSDGTALPGPWQLMEHSIDHYLAASPDRPIIVAYGATWTLSSKQQWHKLFSEKVTNELHRWGGLCLIRDLSENPESVKTELAKFDRTALPLTVIYDPHRKEWFPMPTVFTEDQLVKALSSRQHNQEEQSNAGKPTTRSETKSE
ncbi:hypothetical protein NT6N_31600 [Oceaniferula spumae]|uniref:Thioredoxin domain-containing protein n=1 Tax=Oceaniferula spumae TaxID=2979115 RepID=A0AAT9FQB1_9BACT